MRCLGREAGIDAVMETNGLDFIAAPGDSSLCILAAAAGKSARLLLKIALTMLRVSSVDGASRCAKSQWPPIWYLHYCKSRAGRKTARICIFI